MRRQSARWGLLLALALLAGCSEMLVPQDSETGQLIQQSRAGNAESQYQLGLRYTQGIDLPQNYRKAADQFRQAAESGHLRAQYLLGLAYYSGRGVPQDYARARQWLEQAAAAGHPGAQHQLGDLYLNGRGVSADKAWGIHWLSRAAQRGHAEAQYSLGVAYASGLGLPTDRVEGWKWLKLSELAGHEPATAVQQRLYAELTPLQQRQARYRARNWVAQEIVVEPDSSLVRFAQYRLQQLGYKPGGVDGVMGPRTRGALEAFASERSLAGGVFSGKTLSESLVRALRDAAPQER